jgi:hypothetical protein
MTNRNIKISLLALVFLLPVSYALASTTISTDITTGGDLNVSGTSTLANLTVIGTTTLDGAAIINGSLSAVIVPLQDTASNLSSVVPTSGQMVYETDTKYSFVGDGTTMIGNLAPLGQYGTSSPWGLLSIDSKNTSRPAFVVASSTNTNFIINNNGFAGFGTSSPFANFTVNQPTNNASTSFMVVGGTVAGTNAGSGIILQSGSSGSGSSKNGGSINISTGSWGTGLGSGNGGDMTFTTGTGGGDPSRGGNVSFLLGGGYIPGNGTLGSGGSFSVIAGNGNYAVSVGGSFPGGSISLTGGNAGNIQYGGTAAKGGNVSLIAGNGGVGSSGATSGSGGNLTLIPGAGGSSSLNGFVGVGTSTPLTFFHIVNMLSTASTTVAIGSPYTGTRPGILCFWNGQNYTAMWFAQNSVTPQYATSSLPTCQ